MPGWFAAMVFFAPPILRIIRRKNHPRPDLCKSCGYDMRVMPKSMPRMPGGRYFKTVIEITIYMREPTPKTLRAII